jgi:NADP-dependent 3-hydroxy acid dehydrogenase YdfG
LSGRHPFKRLEIESAKQKLKTEKDQMNSSTILKGKHAVVFGAGGSIGSAVAKEFAAEGAEVFLSGRRKSSVEVVAKQIVAKGGRAHPAAIDSLDDAAVNQYVDGIVKQTGKIDIVLDAAGPPCQRVWKWKGRCGLADRPVHGAV